MKISVLLLILTAVFGGGDCVEFTQPSSVVVKPGESFSISCKISESSYCIHWIRQPAGKPLEWLGWMCSGGDTRIKDSVKNKISFRQDTSISTVYLQGQNFQSEDKAVYYCAIRGGSNAFDYWGKGTSVTVTSGGQTAPTSIFAMSQCGASSEGFLTLGCITSGFSPAETLQFTWKGDVSNAVQYPAIQIQDGKFTAVSQARVKAADWAAKKSFTCQATHSGKTLEAKVLPPIAVPEKNATLLLTTPTQEELETGKATFICVARQFSPKQHSFMWMHDNKEIAARTQTNILTEEKGNVTTYTAISILEIQAVEWIETIKCEFNQTTATLTKEAKYEAIIEDPEKVEIIPPSTEDMLVRRAGDLKCKATGRPGFISIKWIRNGADITARVEGSRPISESTALTAIAKIDYDDWSKGTVYTCVVEHNDFATSTRTYEYTRENGEAKKRPAVYVLPPSDNMEASVTLTCYVKNFYPKELVVHWLSNDEKLNNTEDFQQRTTDVIEIQKNQYSAYSQLVISNTDWESGTVFSCLVYHEAISPTLRLISRSLDNVSNKPTLMSLTMNVPPFSTCQV